MRFKSKIDVWIGLSLWTGLGVPLLALVLLYLDPAKQQEIWVGWLVLALLLALYLGLVWPLYYELNDKVLIVRAGCLRYQIPYAQILKVFPDRNPIASPALSLDRLYVDVAGGKGLHISPLPEADFLTALASKTPHLTLQADKRCLDKT